MQSAILLQQFRPSVCLSDQFVTAWWPYHSRSRVTKFRQSGTNEGLYGVVRCRTCDREVVGSNLTRGCCAPTPTQRIPSLRGRLISTSESWGVNGHTTRYISPVSVVLQLRLVSGWGLVKWRSAPPHGPLRLGKRTFLSLSLSLSLLLTYLLTYL